MLDVLDRIISLLGGIALLAAFIFTIIVIKNKFKYRDTSGLIEEGIRADVLSFCTKKGGAIALIIVLIIGMLAMFFLKPQVFGLNSLYLSRSGTYYYYVETGGFYLPAKIYKTADGAIYLQELYFTTEDEPWVQFHDDGTFAKLTLNEREIVYDVDDVSLVCTLTNDHVSNFTTEDDVSFVWYIVYAITYVMDLWAIGCVASIIDDEKFKRND